ncbi:GAF domain-containing protein [Patulibacter americanus]|uniref:GAF domain-containing protein n=1 Tax=Patulibacter americanus TaxID=588672 RepID=UPI0003B5B8AA
MRESSKAPRSHRCANVPHRRSVDDAAASEQLGGILGVPLLAGDETLGILLAADRRPRSFRVGEVELLASLAAHAAIAIRNARPQHHARTCAELHVHANTLYQRLAAGDEPAVPGDAPAALRP